MKIFIWKRVDKLTDNWHDEGGLVIVAETLEQARALITKKNCEAHKIEPTAIYELKEEINKRMFEFPDAGCC